MFYVEAVEYCEEHECKECPVHVLNLDTRTEKEKRGGMTPCCMNLIYNKEKVKKWIIEKENII